MGPQIQGFTYLVFSTECIGRLGQEIVWWWHCLTYQCTLEKTKLVWSLEFVDPSERHPLFWDTLYIYIKLIVCPVHNVLGNFQSDWIPINWMIARMANRILLRLTHTPNGNSNVFLLLNYHTNHKNSCWSFLIKTWSVSISITIQKKLRWFSVVRIVENLSFFGWFIIIS